MALFKKIYYILEKKKHSASINVDGNGIFSCTVPRYIANALGIGDDIEGKDAKNIEHKFFKYIREYDRLTVKSIYRIKYRIAFSDRIRNQMPGSVMTNEAWAKTSRLGAEYFPAKSLGIIIDWFPLEIRTRGKEDVEMRLRLPEEDDYYMKGAEDAIKKHKDAEFYTMHIHKPYDGLILVHDERHWEFDRNDVYLDIPLTKETFEFFSSIETNFLSMLTKLFAFLSRDEKSLMADIKKMIENKTLKQIGL